MRVIKVVHNPTAGKRNLPKDLLIKIVENAGFECRYSSTKEKLWKTIDDDVDVIFIAGGDGTVKKVAHLLINLEKTHLPIFLYPQGTANNIGLTMGLERSITSFTNMIQFHSIQYFDLGKITIENESQYFLESVGWGVFPKLIQMMDDYKSTLKTPLYNELPVALKKLYKIVKNYQPKYAVIESDHHRLAGFFLMVEIMNTKSIGPQLTLAPLASTKDEYFDLVVIPAHQRIHLLKYLEKRIKGEKAYFKLHPIRVKQVNIEWFGKRMHQDDKVIEGKNPRLNIQVAEHRLSFLVPKIWKIQ